MRLNVNGQKVTFYGQPQNLVSDSVEFVELTFDFSPEWDGYTKAAQFTQLGETHTMLLNNENTCYLPPEVNSGIVVISVFGVKAGEPNRATTAPLNAAVLKSGYVEGAEGGTVPSTPDLLSQLVGVDPEIFTQLEAVAAAETLRVQVEQERVTAEEERVLAENARGAKLTEIEEAIDEVTTNIQSMDTQLAQITQSGLSKWNQAKSQLSEVINLNIIGDSIAEGYNGGDITVASFSNGFVNKLSADFATKYGDVGEGFIGCRYPANAITQRWTFGGTWINYGVYGYFFVSNGMAATTVKDSTASITLNGSGFCILLDKAELAGDISVAVDGGTPEIIDQSAGNQYICEYKKTGLANTSHTVVIKLVTDGKIALLGAYEIKGTTGVRVNKIAITAACIADVSSQVFNLRACIDYWNPKLTIFTFLANDFNSQTPLADFATSYATAIDRALQFGDVMLITCGGLHQQTTQTIPMSEYMNVLYGLAMKKGCAFVDIAKRWGNTYTAANIVGYLADVVHPNVVGHQDIANELKNMLL